MPAMASTTARKGPGTRDTYTLQKALIQRICYPLKKGYGAIDRKGTWNQRYLTPHPLLCDQTHACENITLQSVIIISAKLYVRLCQTSLCLVTNSTGRQLQ